HAAWRQAFDDYDFSAALSAVWKLAAEVNRFLQSKAPWALAKDPAKAEEHRAVLRGASEALLQIAAMASPAIPAASREIAERLGTTIPDDLTSFRWGLLPAEGKVSKRDPLFARVEAAERIEGADKLLKLQLDLGGEKRQIVAGIAKAYGPEQLVGKKIVVVANLKPAKLRGVESQGMLLAADLDGRPIVATFEEDVKPGTRVR